MSVMAPSELASLIGQGLLSFPVTHFHDDLSVDEEGYRSHIAWLLDHSPGGMFAPGGTGELFSLSPAEAERVLAVAVAETRGRVPVVAGVGHGFAIAKAGAEAAERAGADGILLLPPYLVRSEPAGLAAHIEAVCKSTRLGVIAYSRDNAILDDLTLARLCERCPNLIGLKDGVGDIEMNVRIRARLGDRLVTIGGLPTAETFALPCLEMGMATYSSAIFNFLPEFAQAFFADVRSRNREGVSEKLERFVLPYIAIRNRRKGFAVSIVKAGMRAIGRPAGPVRPPLVDLDNAMLEELSRLIGTVAAQDPGRSSISRR